MRRNKTREEMSNGSPGNLACVALALAMVGASWGTSVLLGQRDTTNVASYMRSEQSYRPASTNYHGGSLILTR